MTKSEFDILIVCGANKSGKKTMIDMIYDIAGNKNVKTTSADDMLEKLLMTYGLNLKSKTHADRILIDEIIESLEKHSDLPTKKVLKIALVSRDLMLTRFFITKYKKQSDIDRIKKINTKKHSIKVILLRNTEAEMLASQEGMNNCWNEISPDYTIYNNGTLDEMKSQIQIVIDDLNKEIPGTPKTPDLLKIKKKEKKNAKINI